jgi:hypothetical protein
MTVSTSVSVAHTSEYEQDSGLRTHFKTTISEVKLLGSYTGLDLFGLDCNT